MALAWIIAKAYRFLIDCFRQSEPRVGSSKWCIMDRAIYQPQVRFDARAEREEYERLFMHQARILQDHMVRRSRTDRTRKHDIPEWETVYRCEADGRRVLYQARVLSWGKEKRYYFAHSQPRTDS